MFPFQPSAFNLQSSPPYTLRLAARLAGGLGSMGSPRKERHCSFLLARQQPDGGFAGREGGSDLYYSSFAVRGLAILDGLDEPRWTPIGEYLRRIDIEQLSLIDLTSWLTTALVLLGIDGPNVLEDCDAAWADELAKMLESYRTADGGYAKTHEGKLGSTYHSFLVALCYELLGRPLPQPQRLMQFLRDRQRPDGGFVEIAPMKRGGTNPTAAAVALFMMFQAVDDELRENVSRFLQAVASPEGGLAANTRVPFADLLSTFTGLVTALDLEIADGLDIAAAGRFAEQLECADGGFRGASWDEQADVEYTFYGLAVLSLIAESRAG